MPKQPFEGIRICDLSQNWSGPYCTAYLGGLGAEVIKVESIQHPDTFRFGNLVRAVNASQNFCDPKHSHSDRDELDPIRKKDGSQGEAFKTADAFHADRSDE